MLNEPTQNTSATINKGFAQVPQVSKDRLNQFGRANLAKLTKEAKGSNIMISAWSLQECFGMVRLGAKGKTNDELAKFLNQPASAKSAGESLKAIRTVLAPLMKTDQIRQANGIWVDKGFHLDPAFNASAKSLFDVTAKETAFPQPGTGEINGFVSATTRGKIPKLFNDIPSGTKLVLVNAISFLDKWQLPFDHNMTSDGDFKTPSGAKKAKMMNRKMFIQYAEDSTCQAIKLPYKSGLEMTVWLPKSGSTLESVIGNAKAMTFTASEVSVCLPKWKSEFTWELKDYMMRQGVHTCFDPSADFTGIAKGGLFIGQALQKTYIRVDEDGTEASAATGIMMPTSAMPGKLLIFRADHPFAYAIGAPNGVTLFTGFVNDPTK